MLELKNKIIVLCLSFLICLALMELASHFILQKNIHTKNLSLDEYFRSIKLSWYGPHLNSENCNILDSLTFSSKQGFISKKSKKCNVPITDAGTFGNRNLKHTKEKNEFSLLILGGSLASHLASAEQNSPLEKLLNEKFAPNNKTKFRIYNGAHPGWKMNASLHMYHKYQHLFDGVIAIDGFNEYLGKLSGQEPWTPDPYLTYLSQSNETFLNLRSLFRKSLIYSITFLPFIKHSNLIQLLVPISIKLEHDFYNRPKKNLNNAFVIVEYKKYIQSLNIHFDKNSRNLPTIHFFQPSALYGKKLSVTESSQCLICNPNMKALYEEYLVNYLTPMQKGIQFSYNLSDIYKNETQDVYLDAVHVNRDLGMTVLANQIIIRLEKDWKLKRK